ncbi:MAG: hypothetical protein A2Y25_00520 [Candidatus Melainabacteria bacterium GWF2_37_15]|nr:MAG: hypothetical protein A2Y25_00520 [Candidatus Melainabacteria bacterium GWF2_37_15]
MLNQKQKRLITALITTTTVKEALQKANVSNRSYYNWLDNKEFVDELNYVQQQVYNDCVMDIRNLSKNAVKLYEKLMKSDNESIQLRAAISIINNAGKFLEIKIHPSHIKEEPKKTLFQEIDELTALLEESGWELSEKGVN